MVLIQTLVLSGIGLLIASNAQAAQGGAPDFSLQWSIPFVGLLLSIALVPLVAHDFWHRHFGKVALFWTLAFVFPFGVIFGLPQALEALWHTAMLEYIPFVILLLVLYTVTGGIRITGNFVGTPLLNVSLVASGTLMASLIGTTGAAMLLIRPLLQANANRRYKVHTIIFFIFLVANIGGSLTPLGDPPLFLGFLNGVNFFWPLFNLLWPMLFVVAIVLTLYGLCDYWLYRREGQTLVAGPKNSSLGLEGGINILLLGVVIGMVLISGMTQWGQAMVFGTTIEFQNMARDCVLLAMAGLSWALTPTEVRQANEFSWFPMEEIAKLFAAIFLTIIPVLAVLKSGAIDMQAVPGGLSSDAMYFWATGLLSGFLDNAPTYLVFFNMAGGDANYLMTEGASTLLAISCGSVFMGALSYIGNAPNFMIRAIANHSGIAMPSFFSYVAIAAVVLLPVFALVSWIWFP